MKLPLARQQIQVVAVADSTPMFLRGITATLDSDDIRCLAVGNADAVWDLIGKAPDLLVLDARLLSVQPQLYEHAVSAEVPLVLVVARDEAPDLIPPDANSVAGMWERHGDPAELERIVHAALGGEKLVSSELGAALLDRIAAASDVAKSTVSRLTARESEILTLMADGAGNRAIAEALFISENTVRNHVRNVLEKLQASTRTEAVVRALRAGLVRLK